MELRQRSLVNCRIRFGDVELTTNYVFPFWDRSWAVRFIMIDVLGGDEPRVLAAPLHATDAGLLTDARVQDARPLGQLPRSAFAALYHFDPWWIFRGKGGVAGVYRDVVVPTNVSRPFDSGGTRWKVHDVSFAPRIERAVAIEAKDSLFRLHTFTKADLDLSVAFGPSLPRAAREPKAHAPSPKAL